ncbi:MAG: hypothetical protein J0M08_08065 [Bacteroidetes bacterium]|nr:hypothetical protein [Bacteroidota bacterium]
MILSCRLFLLTCLVFFSFAICTQTTYTVSTLVDESDGNFSAGDFSLREAIEQSNADGVASTIVFAITGGGAYTFTIANALGALPALTENNTLIDGWTNIGDMPTQNVNTPISSSRDRDLFNKKLLVK